MDLVHTLVQKFTQTLLLIGLRYFIFAGLFFLFFYVLFRQKVAPKKIQPEFPSRKDYRREVLYSISTMIIFSALSVLILTIPSFRQHTTLYTDLSLHSNGYFAFAFVLMFFMHDTYFYWMHRLVHHPVLFKTVHLLHHRSTNPSPWAAYSFHPLEALFEFGIFVIFLFTLPVTIYHLGFFFLFMIIYNVYGHLGFELYPKNFNRHWFGKWVNTSVAHNAHHKYFKGNYGLYLSFWDRIMGTQHAESK